MSTPVKTNISYIYATVPANWVKVLHKIYNLMAEYGLDAVKDCKASCNNRNSHIIECYTIFQSALAANNVGRTKEAELLINYLSAQLDIYYNNTEYEFYNIYITPANAKQYLTDKYKVEGVGTIYGEYQIEDITSFIYLYIPKVFENQLHKVEINNQQMSIQKDSETDIDGTRYCVYRFVNASWVKSTLNIKLS